MDELIEILGIDKRADFIFHGLTKSNDNCLVINSLPDNKLKILSRIFKTVYVINENLSINKKIKIKLDENNIKNVKISQNNFSEILYEENFFNLIVIDDIKNFNYINEEKNCESLISILKKILSTNGCIIFNIKKSEVNTNLMKINQKFLQKKFFMKEYLSLSSNDQSLISIEKSKNDVVKGFFINLNSIFPYTKNNKFLMAIFEKFLIIFKTLNFPLINLLTNNIFNELIYCYWKTDDNESIENWIKKELKMEKCIRISRHNKILFPLFDDNNYIKKCVYLDRFGKDFPKKIGYFNRQIPNRQSNERIYFSNWIEGRPVNIQNKNELNLSINELIKYQKEHKLRKIDQKYIDDHINLLLKQLNQLDIKNNLYEKWIEDFRIFLLDKHIFLSPIHGDFWAANLIFEKKNNKISIIDWDQYKNEDFPFEDFIWFLSNLMGMYSSNYTNEFKKHLLGKGEMSQQIKDLQFTIDEHFGVNLNYNLLLKFYLIKWMIKQHITINNSVSANNNFTMPKKYEEILQILSKF